MRILDYSELEKTHSFFANKPCKGIFVFVLSVLLILFGVAVWCVFGTLDDIVKADSLIRPQALISSVRSEYDGMIKAVYYKNNHSVNRGDILCELDDTKIKAELEKQKEDLERSQKELSLATVLQNVIEDNNYDLNSFDKEITVKAVSYKTDLNRMQIELEDARMQYEREKLKPEMFTTKQAIEDLERQYKQASLKLDFFIQDSLYQAVSSVNKITTNIKEINQNIKSLEKQIDASVLTAPSSGKIKVVKPITEGETLFSGEELLQIVPENEKNLKAEIYILTSDIARVHEGDKVRIKLNGLSPARYGYVEGVIALVPPDYNVMTSDIPAFVVEAIIDNLLLENKQGEKIKLSSGLKGEAKVVVGHEKAYVMLLRKLDFLW